MLTSDWIHNSLPLTSGSYNWHAKLTNGCDPFNRYSTLIKFVKNVIRARTVSELSPAVTGYRDWFDEPNLVHFGPIWSVIATLAVELAPENSLVRIITLHWIWKIVFNEKFHFENLRNMIENCNIIWKRLEYHKKFWIYFD